MVKAQEWLTNNYETKKEEETKIKISEGTELEEKLIIDGYSKLKEIYLGGAKGITELTIDNCPSVEILFVADNQITEIKGLDKLDKLRKLSFGGNKIEKIDISKNTQLEMLYFRGNPASLEFTNGLKDLAKLVSWDSYESFPLTKILNQANEEELKEIAKELGINVEEKKPEEIKGAIKAEIEKIKQNKEKLDKELPGLFANSGEVDDNKLKEIKDEVEKGQEYQKLVDEKTNAPIVDQNKIDQGKLTAVLEELRQLHDVANHKDNDRILDNGKFSQDKLDKELAKGDEYTKLVTDNADLVTNDKIDQEKINNLKTAGEDIKNAAAKLGVPDLKDATLESKLGNKKLSDIPSPETLETILEKVTKLEGMLKDIGINPNDADAKKKIAKAMGLVERAREFFGEKYEERLEVEEYQANIEVNKN